MDPAGQENPDSGGTGDDGHTSEPDSGHHGDAGSLPGHVDEDGIRRFDNDADGEAYGERRLGGTYDALPDTQADAVREYTRHSWPYNGILRGLEDLPTNLWNWWNDVEPGWHIFEMNGGRAPSIGDIYDAAHRADLTPEQRQIVNDILSADDPGMRLEQWIRHSGVRGVIARTFGHFPTEADFRERIRLIDEALSHPLPEGVEVQRGLHSVDFMDGYSGSMESLVGTRQTEEAYMSTALGDRPPTVDGHEMPIRLHLDVPEGSRGLWMGSRSMYPDQRELILPRNTVYEITDVVQDESGRWHIHAKVVDTPRNNGL